MLNHKSFPAGESKVQPNPATPRRQIQEGSVDSTTNAAVAVSPTSASDTVKIKATYDYRTNDLPEQLLVTNEEDEHSMHYQRVSSSEGAREVYSRGSILGASRNNKWPSGGEKTTQYSASTGTDNERVYASNTIIASNGEIYHIEPMMLPPPSEIAALFKERRQRQYSNIGDVTPDRQDLVIATLENTPLFKGSYYHQKILRERQAEFASQKKKAEQSSDMFSMREFSTHSSVIDPSLAETPEAVHITRSGMPGSVSNISSSAANYGKFVGEKMYTLARAETSGPFVSEAAGPRVTRDSNSGSPHSRRMSGLDSSKVPPSIIVRGHTSDGTASPKSATVHGTHKPLLMKIDPMRRGEQQPDSDVDSINGSHDLSKLHGLHSGDGASLISRGIDDTDRHPPNHGDSQLFMRQTPEERAMSSSTYFHLSKFSVSKYVLTEMLGAGNPSTGEKQGQENIQNFLKVPYALESLLWLGFLVCLDSFVYVFTYLPVRCLNALLLLILDISAWALPAQLVHLRSALVAPVLSGAGRDDQNDESRVGATSSYFQRTNAYDLARGILVLTGCYALQMLNMSRVYHYIRGQTMIKLYVLTSMLEILDKLMSSFGQDAFDSLHFQLRSVQNTVTGGVAVCWSFVVAAMYVIMHSSIYFIHVATLTVAINSAEQTLVTVLILNNFAEIKSFVFKKFDRTNLFQLACADITERFQITLYLSVIVFVALVQAGDEWMDLVPSHAIVMVMMYIGECLSDWVKHAFISKFNHIDASVYEDFSRVLRKDILSYQKDKEKGVDRTYAITRRVGLSQIPLACVTIRYLNLAWSSPQFQSFYSQYSLRYRCLFITFMFAVLLAFKVLFGVGIFFYAGVVHNRELVSREQKSTGMPNGAKASASALSNIERYSTHKGHVIG